MNNTTQAAKYFNGLIAASQAASVIINEFMGELHIRTSNGSVAIWLLQDLESNDYGPIMEIRNKKYPAAVLKIEDKRFAQQFYNTMKQYKRADIHTRLLRLGFSKITAIAIGLFLLIAIAYIYILPTIAEKATTLLPDSFDNKIGELFMDSFVGDRKIDSTKTSYLQAFAAELDLKNKKPLHFTVVKSKQVNAFALPNGQIVVYSAIIDKMKNAEELAALLGHEASHVNQRHSTKMLCRNLAGYMIISLLFNDVNDIMAVMAENFHQLHTLSYSRKFEQEADELGLKILMDNHINPNGMIRLFEELEKENEFQLPEILSTHPLTKERKIHMQQIISKSPYHTNTPIRLNDLFEKIKKLNSPHDKNASLQISTTHYKSIYNMSIKTKILIRATFHLNFSYLSNKIPWTRI